MGEMFTVKVDVSDAAKILKSHGLEPGGRVQAYFTSELMKLSDPYVPYSAGVLRSKARISRDKCAIEYDERYARYHWFGKLMVDPVTHKGAFYSPTYGFWSRKDVNKVLTNRDLKYNDGFPGGLRGPRWVERCWLNNKYSIITATEEYMKK